MVEVICGADGWEAIEEVAYNKIELLQKYGSFKNGIPGHDTIAVKGNQGHLHRLIKDFFEIMSVIRHLVLNLLKLENSCKKGMKAKRFKAALDTDYAEKMLKLIY